MEYRWYAIQTTAGHENKVRGLLQRRIEEDPRPAEVKLIRQALVPVQEVIEIKNGKKVNVERKLYPGYVLVEMAMSQEALHVVNSIQGVIKFVGTGKLPQPLRQDEVNRLLGIADAVAESEPKEEIPFMIGQMVEITEGPFSDFSGTVEEVLADKGKVKVSVSLFGRPTAVKLECPAGAATPAPPVGTALGPHGVNIMEFVKQFNARTQSQSGMVIPVVVTIYADRTFTFITKTPPAPHLLLKEAGIEKGSAQPNRTKVGKVTRAQVKKIAEIKMVGLNAADLDSAMKMIAGTAGSMGLEVPD